VVEEAQAVLTGLEGAACNPSLAQTEQIGPHFFLAELIGRAAVMLGQPIYGPGVDLLRPHSQAARVMSSIIRARRGMTSPLPQPSAKSFRPTCYWGSPEDLFKSYATLTRIPDQEGVISSAPRARSHQLPDAVPVERNDEKTGRV
jgi:hypothetical protein